MDLILKAQSSCVKILHESLVNNCQQISCNCLWFCATANWDQPENMAPYTSLAAPLSMTIDSVEVGFKRKERSHAMKEKLLQRQTLSDF